MSNEIQKNSFAEQATNLLRRIEYRRADTADELDKIIRLRYKAYLKEGAISASPSERLEDAFDSLSNAHNFGIYIDGRLASALRLHIISRRQPYSPAMESFSDALQPLLDNNKVIIDPNRFVADYDIARHHPELPYLTLRLANVAARYFGGNYVTMTVRSEHQAFYRRGFFAKVVCPPRQYPLLSKPISLLLVDYDNDRERIETRHPYWIASPQECEALLGPGPTYMAKAS